MINYLLDPKVTISQSQISRDEIHPSYLKNSLKRLVTRITFIGGTMELHPRLSQLDKKDFEWYLKACKDDLVDFLEDLGLNNALARQVLIDVHAFLE